MPALARHRENTGRVDDRDQAATVGGKAEAGYIKRKGGNLRKAAFTLASPDLLRS